MTASRLHISDNINNHQLHAEYSEIPQSIIEVVRNTLAVNPSRCLDPNKARGRCLQISHELMFNLAEIGKRPFVDCKILFTPKPHPHFWLYVEGWHIDLTAKQFNSFEQCPKIWKDEDFDFRGIYVVEKGKGMVLFKLAPFNRKPASVYLYQKFILKVKTPLRKLRDLTRKRLEFYPFNSSAES